PENAFQESEWKVSDFEKAIPVVLQHEGGLVDDPDDPGGLTNFGITLKWWQSVDPAASAERLKVMTSVTASVLYKMFWWDLHGYGQIKDQQIATKVFDMSVNMGASQAHRLVQRALGIADDGVCGPRTFAAINNADPTMLMVTIIGLAQALYTDLAARRPTLAKFLPGWLKRASWGV